MSDPNHYTVGWICAVETEFVAAQELLDEEHPGLISQDSNDNNIYALGRIGQHNIVVACLYQGSYGLVSAANVARDMLRTFTNVRFGLMVGIGGGVPTKQDIRLGDIVVSSLGNENGAVFQYDFGQTVQNRAFRPTGHLDAPPLLLQAAVQNLKVEHRRRGNQIAKAVDAALKRNPRLQDEYQRPDPTTDRLYKSTFIHTGPSHQTCASICGNDESTLIVRDARKEYDDNPKVHYGLIASANQLMKDATIRDRLAEEKGVLCFEMEAAGLMNQFKCLVVRGICDYSDSHKNDAWQGYAATAAAAYTKQLLNKIPPTKVADQRKLSELLTDVSMTNENVMHNKSVLDRKEDREILDWLTPLDYGSQHSDYLRRRQSGTGQWLLDSDEYQTWLGTRQQTLFCPGMPGAGKTILASTVINDLEHRFRDDNRLAIAYVSLRSDPFHPPLLKKLHGQHAHKRTRPTLDGISKALRSIIPEYLRVFVVVDALDECQMSDNCRARFLSTLLDLQAQSKINILATSRSIPDIDEKFKDSPRLEVRASDIDIRRYVKGHISELRAIDTENGDFEDEIVSRITEAVDGMFLLAQLYLESLKEKDTRKAIRKALDGMTSKTPSDALYSTAYEGAMHRIESQLPGQVRRAKQVLAWIICAKRPLHKLELQHALAVKLDEPALDPENCPQIGHLVSICAGLVTVDEQSGIIRLVHYTTQDYFDSTKARWFPDAELEITAICTNYLSFDSFAAGHCETDEDVEKRLAGHHLYDYAAHYWGLHARAANANDLVLSFLSKSEQVDTVCQVLFADIYGYRYKRMRYGHEGYSQRFQRGSALHLAAYFGLERAVQILGDCHNVNVKDSSGESSLHLASARGHLEVVKLLVEKHADVKALDNGGWTPLHKASRNGRLEVAKLLIEEGANIDTVTKDGQTPLYNACVHGSLKVVKLLIEKGANLQVANKLGWTPLHTTFMYGHLEVVKLLIKKGADVLVADNTGEMPLHKASKNGNLGVTKLLIEKGADVQATDNKGETPLHKASRNCHIEAAKLLIEKGADFQATNNSGCTPLYIASAHGYLDMAKLLIEKGADFQAVNNDGWTLLYMACHYGYLDMVKLLIEKGADCGCTLLNVASAQGHLDIAKLLIEKGADCQAAYNGCTPLDLASYQGNLDIAKLLIEKGADCQAAYNGCTPLDIASYQGNLDIAKLLINNGADTNATINSPWSPLYTASLNGNLEVVKLLLQHGADSTVPARSGESPLNASLRLGLIDISRALLNKVDVSTESCREDSFRRSLLFYAVQAGLEAFNLIHYAELDINKRDHYGSTLLSVAVRYGHEELANQLLSIPDVDCTLKDNFGRSALWWARKQGYVGIAERILEHARDGNQSIAANEVGLGEPAIFDNYHSYCDVCFATRPENYYHCTDCCGGDLVICLECKQLGAHCLVETHTLLYRKRNWK
ncbi:uncharacterized protein PG998_002595 [Apiospora kogelbergensis]|uniref:uncharacterized protein n=1 Tax=Apiospora kogelbergensis TaxID=1337665 RepID=UPI00312D5A93